MFCILFLRILRKFRTFYEKIVTFAPRNGEMSKPNLLLRYANVSKKREYHIYKMKILLLVIGKTTESYFSDAIKEYGERMKHYISFDMEVIPELKNTKNLSFDQQKEKEADLIFKSLQPGDYMVLLDERGKEYTSLQFAAYLERKMHVVPKRLVFIIGGPYGFSSRVYDAAGEKISLSKMTFSHQMIRMIFVEQLYRAMTILNNEPYHHE